MVQVEDLRMMVGGIQERPGGTGGGDLRMMVGGIGGTGGGPEDDGGGRQERPGGTGGGT